MINIKKIIYNIFIKKFINKKIQFQIGDLRLNKDFDKINKISKNKVIKLSFGDKNPNKNFFVIKRSPGAGFFSNLLYVLKSLEYAEKKNFIPVVDMQNFKNKYSEKKNLNNIKNYWEVCFYKFNKYKLEEVYNSKNVFFSNNNIKITLDDYKRLKIRELYLKYIKVKKNILLSYKNIIKNKFKKYKIVGFHLRGTDQKYSPGHAFPFSIYKAISIIDYNLNVLKFDKIFLITDEKNYFDKIKSKFGEKIIFYNSFRANNPREFNNSRRKHHRNKLGIESLVEALVLSKCHKLIYINSNIPLFSIMISKNKIKKELHDLGTKSKNPLIARFEFFYRILIKDFLLYRFHN